MSLILLGILNSQAAGAAAAGAYDLLETQTLGTAAASVTFTGLDSYSDYKHLQIRMTARSTSTGAATNYVLFNGDTGSNYSTHLLRGSGSSVLSFAYTSEAYIRFAPNTTDNSPADAFRAVVMDILDFSSTNKNTTIRAFSGAESNSTNVSVDLRSGLWNSTAAVTSLEIKNFNTYVAGSRFSLFGVR